jgi:serralysin
MLSFNLSYTGFVHRHELRRSIGEKLFGANLLITSAQPDGALTIDYGYGAAINSVGISNLRYPGGTVTEYHFDLNNPEARQSIFSNSQALIPQQAFLDYAAAAETSVTLVIPTRVAFGVGNDAWSALQNGTYGNRQVSESYLEDVATWVEYAVIEASQRGVQIAAFEIGNEFWLSGEMTSAEYGRVASAVLSAANTGIEGLSPWGRLPKM